MKLRITIFHGKEFKTVPGFLLLFVYSLSPFKVYFAQVAVLKKALLSQRSLQEPFGYKAVSHRERTSCYLDKIVLSFRRNIKCFMLRSSCLRVLKSHYVKTEILPALCIIPRFQLCPQNTTLNRCQKTWKFINMTRNVNAVKSYKSTYRTTQGGYWLVQISTHKRSVLAWVRWRI